MMAAPFRIRRRDEGVRALASTPTEEFKFYLDRLMKMIPGDAVGLYMIGSGFIPAGQAIGLVIWTVICLVYVVLIKAYGTADPDRDESPDWVHVAISAIAFVIWVYTLGGPFAVFNLGVPYIGSLLVLAWTFFIPIFYKGV
jgi:hypothetical protein